MNRRTFLHALTAGLTLLGFGQRGEAKTEERWQRWQWWQAGDYLTRPTPRDHWTRAQSFESLQIGHEFGTYDGNGQVTNYGPISFKTRWRDRGLWATDSTMWSTLA